MSQESYKNHTQSADLKRKTIFEIFGETRIDSEKITKMKCSAGTYNMAHSVQFNCFVLVNLYHTYTRKHKINRFLVFTA